MNPTGPQNAVVGNDSFGTDIPQTNTPDPQMEGLSKAAKFSKTAEFKELKEHFVNRMNFYASYMPDGKPIITEDMSMSELGYHWIIANTIIGEFQAVLDVYEGAAQTIKEQNAQRKGA